MRGNIVISLLERLVVGSMRSFHRLRLGPKFMLVIGIIVSASVSALYIEQHSQKKRAVIDEVNRVAETALNKNVFARNANVNQSPDYLKRNHTVYSAAQHDRIPPESVAGDNLTSGYSLDIIRLDDHSHTEEALLLRKLDDVPSIETKRRGFFYTYTNPAGRTMYRRVVPLLAEKGCLECHPRRGFKSGQVVAGMALSLPMDEALDEIARSKRHCVLMAVAVTAMILGTLFLLLQTLVLSRVGELVRVTTNIRTGKHGTRVAIESGDEFEELSKSINAMTEEIIRGHMVIIKSLASALEYRDPYTRGHVDRVSEYATAVAAEMGLDDEMVLKTEMSAILHDIGKIGISDSILKKQGPLDELERQEMGTHTEKGAAMIPESCLRFAQPAILHHHERWDGQGYPWGLNGKKIPVMARILAVVDTFDAMTTDRPYRRGMTAGEAVAEIRAQSGKQFDPEVVQAFLATLDRHGYPTRNKIKQARGSVPADLSKPPAG